MPALRPAISAPDRRALASQALKAAVAARAKGRQNQQSPICIYGLSEALGVTVRFNDINMEGMYEKGERPRIHLSAKRPLVRRAYNCAHELGHHIFKHGLSIDELKEDARESSWDDPKEFLADTFAGFVLMPIVGLRQSFSSRGWNPVTASAAQMYIVACDFGVGYGTLLTHLSAGVGLISFARAAALRKATLKSLRTEIVGDTILNHLVVADRHRLSPVLDVEVGMHVLLPVGVEAANPNLKFERDTPVGRLFKAERQGIVQTVTPDGAWANFVRIAPKEYIGLAQYRHLEEDPDE
jgi:hypothetical protein